MTLRRTGSHRSFLAAGAIAVSLCATASAAAAPGDLDTTFGTGGIADYTNDAAFLSDVAPYPDESGSGGFVASGYRGTDPVLLRLDGNGQIDHSFGSGGVYDTRLGDVSRQRFEAVAVDSLGRILVAGSSYEGDDDFFVARFTPGGALDPNWGSGGVRKLPTSGDASRAWDLAVTPGWDAVVVGDVRSRTPTGAVTYSARAAMLSDRGSVMWDRTLRLSSDPDQPTGQSEFAHAVALQPDGRIVVAGRHALGSNSQFGVARLNADGSTDRGFADSGGRSFYVGAGPANPHALAAAIDSTGRIVLGGSVGRDEDGGWNLLARLTAAGQLDSTFDGDGLIEDFSGSGGEGVRDLAIDSQDRIVAAGYVGHHFYTYDAGVTRYLPSGAADPSFGSGGKVNITDPGDSSLTGVAGAWGVTLQGSNIVVVGHRAGGFAARLLGEPGSDQSDPPSGGSGGVAGDLAASPGVRVHKLVIPKSRRKLAAKGIKALASCDYSCQLVLEVRVSKWAAARLGLDSTLLARGVGPAAANDREWVRARFAGGVARALRAFGGAAKLKVSVTGEPS